MKSSLLDIHNQLESAQKGQIKQREELGQSFESVERSMEKGVNDINNFIEQRIETFESNMNASQKLIQYQVTVTKDNSITNHILKNSI